ATRIQLSDQFSSVENIRDFIAAERDKMSESDRSKMTISLKIDENTKMGFVTDVKQALRRANALKISYNARKDVPKAK
ncbi:MAG: ExbD/TolR family protein, partial [Bacteroidales bacterium]